MGNYPWVVSVQLGTNTYFVLNVRLNLARSPLEIPSWVDVLPIVWYTARCDCPDLTIRVAMVRS